MRTRRPPLPCTHLPLLVAALLLGAGAGTFTRAHAAEGDGEAAGGKPGGKMAYGFRGFELYKFDAGIDLLASSDVDGDGLKDLLFANNNRARIEVLLRRREPVPPKSKKGEKLPNELVDDQFFERKELLTEKQVWALAPGDFNNDGKVDVAYAGKPDELVVAYGDGTGQFARTAAFPIDDAGQFSAGLAAGDLDGNGRMDLVLLAKEYTAVYYQSDKGTLQEPRKIPHAVKGIQAVLISDLDGDGRHDLVHLAPADARSVRVSLQRADGTLGAEIAFETSPWRFVALENIDAKPGSEVLVIQRASGMLRALRVGTEAGDAAAEFPLGSPEIHAFEQTQGSKPRSMDIGDVDGDGRLDIVVTEPGTAQVAVYRQDDQGLLTGRRTFPSLSNCEALRLADLDGNGRAEFIVLSGEERAVGISSLMENGRLPFPELLQLPGQPKAIDTGDLNGDGRTDLVVIVEKDKARSALLFVQEETGGLPAEPKTVELEGLKQAPDEILIVDLDQDGHADLLLFDRFGPARIWRATGDGTWVDTASGMSESQSGMLQKLERGNVAVADLDGDGKAEMVVASKNFARALRIEPGKGLDVVDQANGASPRSQIKGAAVLDLDGDGQAEVALFDRDKNVISVLRRDAAGVFGILGHVPVGTIDYQALFARDVNGDGRADLVLFGKDRFGVLYSGGRRWELGQLHVIESTVRDANLMQFAVGDLNGDGGPDLAVLDAGNRGLQIFSYDAGTGFGEQVSWPIYEKKMHEERGGRDRGAHAVLIDDLDGDGANDIAVLVHDRLIVYPQ